MDSQEKKTSKIPYVLTKNELVRLCHPLSEHKVRNRINTIIYDIRKKQEAYKDLSKKQIIGTHQIERIEIIEYFETYGLPPGYEF